MQNVSLTGLSLELDNDLRLLRSIPLNRYGIENGCMVECTLPGIPAHVVQLTVTTAAGNDLNSIGPFHSNMSVVDVKRHVEKHKGIPLCTQQLLLGHVVLDDAQYLRDLIKASTEQLHLTLVLMSPSDPAAILAQMPTYPHSIQDWVDAQDLVFARHLPEMPQGWIRVWSKSQQDVYYLRMIDNARTFDIKRVM